MSIVIGAANRAQLSQSLPIVLQHREHLFERLEAQLAQLDPPSVRNSKAAATALIELLIEAVQSIVDTGLFSPNLHLAAELDALDIGGRHYSRFGDALVPTLKDISLPAPVAALWCDIFWSAIREASGFREAV